jgi:hypothetical protein
MEVKELVRKYGLSLALTKKVCEYFKSEDEINEVLSELSHSNLITDSKKSLFDIYLENHPERRKDGQ